MNTSIQKNVIQTFRVWTWILYFSLGGGYYLLNWIKIRISIKWHGLIMIVWTVINVAYQLIVGTIVIHNTYAEYVYDSLFEIVWIILIVSFVIRINLSAIRKYIEFLSPLTMGVFIIHPLVNRLCLHFLM